MGDLQGKKILLGVSGSIAAYKAVYLLRELQKSGAEVRVIMTRHATEFVTALTFEAISHHAVHSDITSQQSWNNHIEAGLWADLYIIAPATANIIAKMNAGLADDMVSACYLAARCPIMIAPAMDVDMWHHQATQHNVKSLMTRGVEVLPVGYGSLASGLIGAGRMIEPLEILDLVKNKLSAASSILAGKTIMVTAGPTYEAIDPVRFIGNASTGKMGIAIADALVAVGAHVTLILGPSSLLPTHASIQVIRVRTADEMLQACIKVHATAQICIFTAAVADYKPKQTAKEKIKKTNNSLDIHLVKTPDIAFELGLKKKKNQMHIGFALESTSGENYAKEKLKKKNFDMVVLNSLNDPGAGFAADTNKTTFFFKNNKSLKFELKSKSAVAQDILQSIVTLLNDK